MNYEQNLQIKYQKEFKWGTLSVAFSLEPGSFGKVKSVSKNIQKLINGNVVNHQNKILPSQAKLRKMIEQHPKLGKYPFVVRTQKKRQIGIS